MLYKYVYIKYLSMLKLDKSITLEAFFSKDFFFLISILALVLKMRNTNIPLNLIECLIMYQSDPYSVPL